MTIKKNAKPSFYDAMDAVSDAYTRLEDEAYATGFAGALSVLLKNGCPVETVKMAMVHGGMSLAQMKDLGITGYDYDDLCERLKVTKAKPKASKPKASKPKRKSP